MSPSNQEQSPPQELRTGVNLAMYLIETYAVSVEVLLHHQFGERYLGTQAAGVLLLIPLHAACWERHNPAGLVLFWVAYLIASLLQRIGVLSRWSRGEVFHSRYNGTPWLMPWFRMTDELKFKRQIEPGLVGLAGILVGQINMPLASYLVFAGTSLALKMAAHAHVDRQRLLDLNDAVIEQRYRGEQFHDLQ